MSERIHSVGTLRDAIEECCREYIQHVEPTATADLYSMRLEVVGSYLSITLASAHGRSKPDLHINMTGSTDDRQPAPPPPEPERRGFLR